MAHSLHEIFVVTPITYIDKITCKAVRIAAMKHQDRTRLRETLHKIIGSSLLKMNVRNTYLCMASSSGQIRWYAFRMSVML